eukprot:Gregarina_sp_Poly_1__3621@NODE_2067_length_2740_cov_256_289188_g45_i2_p2_GENE_NODE_2067_length_2740_cov_256_289188_g45_i2NODE_2067_length_2740_cov_256_289188_g45_i2_p2_ORF_typecomplete_len177_score23_15NatB_MDM20/PF09797_9/0_021Gtr1_RagA/PF04670_12/0_45_NODE_2067_length_2740_cov_256_289188_g45_i215912121
MRGISKVSNSTALIQVIDVVNSLINADEVQEKLRLAIDTHELVKALNRVTGSHEHLSPHLLAALEACRRFCQSIQAATLARMILERHQALITHVADHSLTEALSRAVEENVIERVDLDPQVNRQSSLVSKLLADGRLLLEHCQRLCPENIETPPEAVLRDQLRQCSELLETILPPS